jgi:RNA polymerase sigma-70 factor (ECF subfamily)
MRAELTQAADLLRKRDASSMEEVLRLLQETVYSFSMKFCGHREDAEDNMQEVLMRALPNLAALESPDALAVWLYKVTRNRCWESRRRGKFAPRQTSRRGIRGSQGSQRRIERTDDRCNPDDKRS